MRFFFFGSLLDADVLELVLGRRLPAEAWEPALLDGYVRALFAKESYPVIVPRPGGTVDGAVVRGLSSEDRARIVWFEEGEYDLTKVTARLCGGRRVEVNVCVARRELPQRAGDWSLARWRCEEKPAFMALARAWMALHGHATLAEAEAEWDALKAASESVDRAAPLTRRLGS